MYEESFAQLTAGNAALLKLGVALGQNHAFGMIAGRCSAAQAVAELRNAIPKFLSRGRKRSSRRLA